MCLDVKVISPLCTRSIYELSSTSFLFRSKFVYIYDFILCLKCSWNNLCSCSVLNCLLSTFYLSSKIVRANVWMCNVKRLQRLPATTSAKKEKKISNSSIPEDQLSFDVVVVVTSVILANESVIVCLIWKWSEWYFVVCGLLHTADCTKETNHIIETKQSAIDWSAPHRLYRIVFI